MIPYVGVWINNWSNDTNFMTIWLINIGLLIYSGNSSRVGLVIYNILSLIFYGESCLLAFSIWVDQL